MHLDERTLLGWAEVFPGKCDGVVSGTYVVVDASMADSLGCAADTGHEEVATAVLDRALVGVCG